MAKMWGEYMPELASQLKVTVTRIKCVTCKQYPWEVRTSVKDEDRRYLCHDDRG